MKRFKNNMSTLSFVYFLIFWGFCSTIEFEFHVFEEEPINTFIGSVSNPNTSSQSTRYLIIESKKNLFSINKDSGEIYTAKHIDREDLCASEPVCIFVVKVRIDSKTFEIVKVNIWIDDINDNAPVFEENEVSLKITENNPLETLYPIVDAWDSDSGINNSMICYTLLKNDNNRFSLMQNNKQVVRLKINKALDYEEQKFYQLTIVAKDQGIPQRSGSMLINITVLDENDNTPKFEKVVYNETIFENVPIFSTILRLRATDKDSDINGKVRYKLSHKTSAKIKEIFEVKESSGEIILKGSLSDRYQYSFTVIGYDEGLRSRSSSASVFINIVDVNDNPPHIVFHPSLVNISELQQPGFHVAFVSVSDKDKGDNGKVYCSIADVDQYFKLKRDSNTYQILIRNKLDFENITTHNITIKCEDNGTPKLNSEKTIIVNVIDYNDNPPIFNSEIKIVNITENNPAPKVIAEMTATDKDNGVNSEIYYYLEPHITSDFTINNRTAMITTNKIFDRENISVIQFKVFAVDSGVPSLTGTATVRLQILDINDNIPQFQKQYYKFQVLEAQSAETIIGTVKAKDLDTQENGTVSYIIEKKNIASQVFIVTDGTLKTKAILNRTEAQKYNFVVVAIDHGKTPLNSSCNVIVVVEDTNNNSPYIIYPSDANNSISVSYEMTPADQPISQVIAYDNDEGENARLSYFFKNTPEIRNLFRINETSGEIMLVKDSKVENLKQTYKLLISVKDHGKPHHNTHAVLFVYMTDGKKLLMSRAKETGIILGACAAFVLLFVAITAYIVSRTEKQKRRYSAKKYEDASLRRKRYNFPKKNEFNNNGGKSSSEVNESQFSQENGNSFETVDIPPTEIPTPRIRTATTKVKEPLFQYSNLLCKDEANSGPTEDIEESVITEEFDEIGGPLDRASIKGSCAALLDG